MKNNFYGNFEKALTKLLEFQKIGIKDELDRAGFIQAFEFTFEQAWKAIQKKSGEEGFPVSSPMQAFSWGLSRGWITTGSEAAWVGMVKDRNLTTHTYRESLAEEIHGRIESSYIGMFNELLSAMKGDPEDSLR